MHPELEQTGRSHSEGTAAGSAAGTASGTAESGSESAESTGAAERRTAGTAAASRPGMRSFLKNRDLQTGGL